MSNEEFKKLKKSFKNDVIRSLLTQKEFEDLFGFTDFGYGGHNINSFKVKEYFEVVPLKSILNILKQYKKTKTMNEHIDE